MDNQETQEPNPDRSPALAATAGSVVYLVWGEHNRRGSWLAAAYDNETAAKMHKEHLDATKDGWENFDGGTYERVQIESVFNPPNEKGQR